MCVVDMSQNLANVADIQCNVTGAQAQEGAGPDAGYIVQWFLDYGLTKDSDPMRIVCTNTTTSQ